MTESRSQKNTNNSWTRGYPTPQCTHCALETFPSVADLPLSHWCQHPADAVLRSWPQGVANQSAATTLLGHKVGGSQRLPPFFSSHFGILWQDEKVYSFLEASFPFSSSLSGYPCHHWWDGAGDQIYIHPEHPTVHLDWNFVSDFLLRWRRHWAVKRRNDCKKRVGEDIFIDLTKNDCTNLQQ